MEKEEEYILEFFDEEAKPEKKTSETDEQEQGWGSPDHIYLGNKILKAFIEKKLNRKDRGDLEKAKLLRKDGKNYYWKLLANNQNNAEEKNLELTAGQIVAFAGDFYAIPEKPICFGENFLERKNRFIEAYNTLANEEDIQKIENLSNFLNKDLRKIKIAQDNDEVPSTVFDKFGKTFKDNLYFMLTTSEHYTPCSVLHNLYLGLVLTNFDHFGKEAKRAYKAGHAVALETADKARLCENEEEKIKLFALSINQELFACHYLTDLFAAGHIRTPRKQILNHFIGNPLNNNELDIETVPYRYKAVSGLLALKMHNEDGKNGLNVSYPPKNTEKLQVNEKKNTKFLESSNEKGKEKIDEDSEESITRKENSNKNWEAYGDGYYFDKNNKNNQKYLKKSVLKGLKSIYSVYLGDKKLNTEQEIKNIKYRVPKAELDNSTPLFKISDEGNKIEVRKLGEISEDIGYETLQMKHCINFFRAKEKKSNQYLNKEQTESLFNKFFNK